MAKIVEISIKNFRGIKTFEQKFSRDFNCFVGRGDSGKSTILQAIEYTLSPSRNISFQDTDFFNGNIEEKIEINVTMINIPETLIYEDKFGLLLRSYNEENGNISDEISEEGVHALTIRFSLDKYLEPRWHVISNREIGDKEISAYERAKLNCFMVSDYIDRHFSWQRGTPLYNLQKLQEDDLGDPDNGTLLDIIRQAKSEVDSNNFDNFEAVTKKIQAKSAEFGLDVDRISTTVDFKDIFLKEERVCLHENSVPYRLKGKGSKRLLSIAIQSVLAEQGGIILIDEIEQGLEPDRAKQLVRSLVENNHGQYFFTTHSREVITELDAKDLTIIHRDKKLGIIKTAFFERKNNQIQGVIRACPEAFFAKKVIVCEGATEIGISRALDKFRQNSEKELMSFLDCAYIDGGGASQAARALEIKNAGFEVALFCDSDVDLSPSKDEMTESGIMIVDCEDRFSIEKQVFMDMPWEAVIELVDIASSIRKMEEQALLSSIKSKYGADFPEDWRSEDTSEMRSAIADTSIARDKEWFKRIDRGQILGEIIFKYFDQIEGSHLHAMFTKLSNWIDE